MERVHSLRKVKIMADPAFELYHYLGAELPTTVKSVTAQLTSSTAASLWTPATGRKFQLMGGNLTVSIGTVTGTAVAGDLIVLCDNAVTSVVHVLGVFTDAALVAGGIFGTSAQGDTAYDGTADTISAGPLPHVQTFKIPYGYLAAAANNVLKAAVIKGTDHTAQSIGSGTISIMGTIWGHEA
jgi:hypothetical protein